MTQRILAAEADWLRRGVFLVALFVAPAVAQTSQIDAGARVYARNCAPCHGVRMRDPEGAFDLRKFPRDNRDRFVSSVLNGKGQMPPWNGLLSPEEVEQVWSYVLEGEK